MAANVVRELVTLMGFRLDKQSLDKANRGLSRVSNKMKVVGRNMTLGITAPLIAAGVGILKIAADFESSMKTVQVLTGATTTEFKKLEDQAKLLGRTTKFTASESAQAMGFLAQAGFDVNQIYGAMPAVLDLAAASGQDLALTADQLSNIMTQFNINASDSSRVADILAKTASSTNTNITQLAEAMSFAGGLASKLGLSVEKTSALLGIMGNAGVQATRAGTTLRGAMLRLVNPTEAAQKVLNKLNVSVSDGKGGIRDFVDIIDDMERAQASAADISKIFGTVATSGILAVVSAGKEMRDAQIAKNIDSIGEASKQAAVKTEGLAGTWLKTKSAFEGLVLKFATEGGFASDVTAGLENATKLLDGLAKTNPELVKLGKTLVYMLGAAGPLTLLLGWLLKINPAILAFTALFVAVGHLKKLADESGEIPSTGKFDFLTPSKNKKFYPVQNLFEPSLQGIVGVPGMGRRPPSSIDFGSTTINVNVPEGTTVDQSDAIGSVVKRAVEDAFDEKSRHLNSQSFGQ